MSLLLKITLSVLTILTINGCAGIGLWFGVKDYLYPLNYVRGKYALISIILMGVAICYIPFLDGIDTVTPVYMQFDRRNKRLLETYSADGSGPTEYPFSEYGKTWALTKEELEK